MNRRQFVQSLGASAVAAWGGPQIFAAFGAPRAFAEVAVLSRGASAENASAPGEGTPPPSVRELALTIDDPNLERVGPPSIPPKDRDQRILEALAAQKLQAALFVCGMRVESPEGSALLQRWNDAGHILGNHTYSHTYYPKADFAEYKADILRCEKILTPYTQFRRRFRYPYLKEGKTAEQRDSLRAFLHEHEYRSGAVTIDASDWAIDARLRKKLAADPRANVDAYRDFYLEHIADRAAFYDDLAHQVLGRGVRHTLLIHHNLLNALFLSDLMVHLEQSGWKLISADAAFSDPIFEREPNIAPAGESIVWALAREAGTFDDLLRYPAEDESYEVDRMNALQL